MPSAPTPGRPDIVSDCEYNLAFPFHGEEPPSARLAAIQAFGEENGRTAEYFLDGTAAEALEGKVAALLGKQSAMWCPTGTLAQSIAARIYSLRANNDRLLLHPTSHLLLHEQDGYRHVHGLAHDRLGEWENPVAAGDLHGDAACAFVELPQRHNGGLLPSWDALEALKHRAQELALPLHIDGARLWSCRPFYDNRTYAQIADGFESVYVSLYKDIGALGGAVLAGENAFISEARIWRTRLGGLTAVAWPTVFDALRLIDGRIAQMPQFVSRAHEIAHLAARFAALRVHPQPPHTNMFHIHLPCSDEAALPIRDAVARTTGVWIGNRFWPDRTGNRCALEICVGETALAIPDARLESAFSLLAQEFA